MIVTTGILMQIAFGRFLKKKKNEFIIYYPYYFDKNLKFTCTDHVILQ